MNLGLVIDIKAPSPTGHRAVLNSIQRYRDGCRQLFPLLVGCDALGAKIVANDERVTLKANSTRTAALLSLVMGGGEVSKEKLDRGRGVRFEHFGGAISGYDLRTWFFEEIYPSALSFVWDSARAKVVERWKAMDAEFPKATRRFLILQGMRGMAQFRNTGIAFQQATGHPKLAKNHVTLKWDSEIGAIEFFVPDMDPGRFRIYRKILDGEWPAGAVTLNERDGKLRLVISYDRPEEAAGLDPQRLLVAKLSDAQDALVLVGPDGEHTFETVPLRNMLDHLTQLNGNSKVWEERRKSCGSVVRSWGHRRKWRGVQRHLKLVTAQRAGFKTDTCSALARRIASLARIWRCGRVELHWLNEIGGHPFPRSEFVDDIRYKLGLIGGSLVEAAVDNGSLTT